MKWLVRILLLIALLFAGAYFVSMRQTDGVKVERTRIIANLSPSEVHLYLDDMDFFSLWSPWDNGDGTTQYRVEGSAGLGQSVQWTSQSPTPARGSLRIIETAENSYVRTEITLDDQSAIGTFALTQQEDGTLLVLFGIEVDTEPGGLPFKRWGYRSMRRDLENKLDRALSRLERAALAGE